MLNLQQLAAIYDQEQILIILLARLHFDTCAPEAVSGFIEQHPIDWRRFMKLAEVHGIRSFIFSVSQARKIALPDAPRQRLTARYEKTRIKNFNQFRVSTELINQFKQKGISLIPYKGSFFAFDYYKDWAARESIDIDFLVPGKAVELVEDYLIEQNLPASTTVKRGYLGYYQAFFKDIVYGLPNINSSVEIHWRLMDRFTGPVPGHGFFASHLVPFTNGSFSAHKLAPTYDFLIMSFNHIVKDMNTKFKYLIDAGAIISKCGGDVDMEVIGKCAKEYAFEKRLATGLGLLNDLLGIEFPGAATNLPEDILKMPLAADLPRLYITEPRFIKLSLAMQDNWVQQIKFLGRCLPYFFLPTYEDINRLKLPAYFLPLLIIIRPFRIAYQALSQKRKRIRNADF